MAATLIRSESRQGTLVVTLLSEQLRDYEQVRQLQSEINDAISSHDASDVILDMQAVKAITSVAFLTFVSIRKTAELRGGAVVLCNLNDQVLQTLTVSQLIVETRNHSRFLLMSNDVESALSELASMAT